MAKIFLPVTVFLSSFRVALREDLLVIRTFKRLNLLFVLLGPVDGVQEHWNLRRSPQNILYKHWNLRRSPQNILYIMFSLHGQRRPERDQTSRPVVAGKCLANSL